LVAPQVLLGIVLVLLDLITAVLLGALGVAEQRSQLASEKRRLAALVKSHPDQVAAVQAAPTLIRTLDTHRGLMIAAFWLLNPLAILTCP
jgi:hypothetical protein